MKTKAPSIRSWGMVLVLSLAWITTAGVGCTKKKDVGNPNTLHLATNEKIKGLDPAFADDLYSGTEVGRVYEGLLQYHYLKRPYVLIPNLAESLPEYSSDKKTLTFKIKKGIVFQDSPAFKETTGKGRELVAEDFVYSFKRLADPKNASSGWWIFDGRIAGLNEWRDEASKIGSTDYAKPVEGLKAIDRYTLQIKLKQPSYQFLYYLAMPFASVVAKEAVDHFGKEFLNNPVGTGPYRLVEFNPASKLVWEKNPTYRKEFYPSEGEAGDQAAGVLADAGKPLPLSDRLEVVVFVESQPKWLNFMAGKIDLTTIPKDNFSQAITPSKDLSEDLKKKGVQLIRAPSLDVTFECFNMHDALMGKNKFLRQALSVVHESGPMIDLFYNGQAVAAQGPIPPGLSGSDPEFKNPYRQFNVDKAKELLAKAGFPEGKGLAPIEYSTVSSTTSRQMTEYLEKNFAKIGVKLKVNTYSWPEFQASIKNKKGQMYGFAWGADYPDAENFLQLFYGKNITPGPNSANYVNAEYDRLYDQSLTLPEGAERTAVYKKMVQILVEDAPMIWGVHRMTYTLVNPWLRNYKIHDFDHTSAKYLRVDAGMKK